MEFFIKDKYYARLTVDMTPDEHTYLKMASSQLGMSMREFILMAGGKSLRNFEEDRVL